MNITQKQSRHQIFNNVPIRESKNISSSSSVSIRSISPIVNNQRAEFSIREAGFQLQSISSVLKKLDHYQKSTKQVVQKLNNQLQQFNLFQERHFDEEEIFQVLTRYYQTIQEFQELLTNYKMIKYACPGEIKEIGIRLNMNVGETKNKLLKILTDIKQIRDNLFQHAFQVENGIQIIDIEEESKYLQSFIEINKPIMSEMMIIILKHFWSTNENNFQIYQRHKSKFLQLQSVFQSIKLMMQNQKEMKRLIQHMSQHFIHLRNKLNKPNELLKQREEFSEFIKIKKSLYRKNKTMFQRNMSNSFIANYKQQFQKFLQKNIIFQKAFQQDQKNGIALNNIYYLKSELERMILKKNKNQEEIKQIQKIYQSLIDLETNKQLQQYKNHLINQHKENLKMFEIDVRALDNIGNCLLESKIKQFNRLVEGGLMQMSTNIQDLKISQSQINQILNSQCSAEETQQCKVYSKQIQIALELVSAFDYIRKQQYKIIQKNLYHISQTNTLEKEITDTLSKIFQKYIKSKMIPKLQQLFYHYTRDLVILSEISGQYGNIKNNLKQILNDPNKNSILSDDILEIKNTQLIFPVLKSIRNMSQADRNIKTYLLANVYKVFSEFSLKLFQKSFQTINSDFISQKIKDNPGTINNLQSLCHLEVRRRKTYFTSQYFYKILEYIIQYLSESWFRFTLKQKICQLVKLFLFKSLLQSKDIRQKYQYSFFMMSIQFLLQYLTIDMQIRVIIGISSEITFKDPLLLQLIKLAKAKDQCKYNPLSQNSSAVFIRRIINSLQSSSPFQLSTDLSMHQLINQLRVVEVSNDLFQISELKSLLQVVKRSLLYYYMESILKHQSISNSQIRIKVQKSKSKYFVDTASLMFKINDLAAKYRPWAQDLRKKINQQIFHPQFFSESYLSAILQSVK